jgi:hypothetical protein
MYEKNSSGWFLQEAARLSDGRLTPVRVIGCSPSFEVHVLVEEHHPEAIASTERLLTAEVEPRTRVRIVSRESYERDAEFMREAIAAAGRA